MMYVIQESLRQYKKCIVEGKTWQWNDRFPRGNDVLTTGLAARALGVPRMSLRTCSADNYWVDRRCLKRYARRSGKRPVYNSQGAVIDAVSKAKPGVS